MTTGNTTAVTELLMELPSEFFEFFTFVMPNE